MTTISAMILIKLFFGQVIFHKNNIYSAWLCKITSKIATTFTFGVGVTDIVLALFRTLAVVVMIVSPKQERNPKTKRQATTLTDILLLPCLKMHIPEKD